VQVAAIIQVDRRAVGTGQMGPVVRQLRDVYFQAVRGQLADYRDWCTPVYASARVPSHVAVPATGLG
jgi:branched-chain amino acid aminotransferase